MQQATLLPRKPGTIEWPTIGLAIVIYVCFLALTYWHAVLPWFVLMPLAAYTVAWHSSLLHELVHGHPTRSRRINALIGSLPLLLWLPFDVYRSQHLKHHQDANLTDPLDDPESYYVTPASWARLPAWRRRLLTLRNTLVGRLTVGTLLVVAGFLRSQLAELRRDAPGVRRAWAKHFVGCALVIAWLVFSRPDATLAVLAADRMACHLADAGPLVPRAPGAAGRRAPNGDRRGWAADAALVPQQQSAPRAPCEAGAALVCAARGLSCGPPGLARQERRLCLSWRLCRDRPPLRLSCQGAAGPPVRRCRRPRSHERARCGLLTGLLRYPGRLPEGLASINAAGENKDMRQGLWMDYSGIFSKAIDQVRAEGRYRVFADLEREVGRFRARGVTGADGAREVTVWCSNDYLGMGQHPVVLEGAAQALGGTVPAPAAPATSPAPLPARAARGRARGPARQGGGAAVHLGLCRQRGGDLHHRQAAAGLPDLSDAQNHASMIAGIAPRAARSRIFRHNDLGHLEAAARGRAPARAPS